MKKIISMVILLAPLFVCFAQDTATKITPWNKEKVTQIDIEQKSLSECEKAGGRLTKIKECDGSESDYCDLTDKIHCYADLVKDGKCTMVEFSEKWFRETGDGMIGPGSGPRVLCDNDRPATKSE